MSSSCSKPSTLTIPSDFTLCTKRKFPDVLSPRKSTCGHIDWFKQQHMLAGPELGHDLTSASSSSTASITPSFVLKISDSSGMATAASPARQTVDLARLLQLAPVYRTDCADIATLIDPLGCSDFLCGGTQNLRLVLPQVNISLNFCLVFFENRLRHIL